MYREKKWKYAKTRTKYRNKPQDAGGYTYHSIKEAKYARDLELRKKAGDIKDWARQVKIELYGENGGHICDYHVDFRVEHNDGTIEYVEVKGFETRDWRIKWKLFEDKMRDKHDVTLTIIR